MPTLRIYLSLCYVVVELITKLHSFTMIPLYDMYCKHIAEAIITEIIVK